MRKNVIGTVVLVSLFMVGCLGRNTDNEGSPQPCKLGNGLEPTIDEVLPGRIIFSYKRTAPLYETVEGKRIWRPMENEDAYSTVLEGMHKWKEAHPKAIIHGVQVIGTFGDMPTMFLVEYYNPRE